MSEYDDAYKARGGHPDLMARRLRAIIEQVDAVVEAAFAEGHPVTRRLVVESLSKARRQLYEALAIEASREGDDWKAARGPRICPQCNGQRLVGYDSALDPVTCPLCSGEGLVRASKS